MKIIYTSDLHVDPNHLDRLLAAGEHFQLDAVLIGGDLIPVGGWTLSASIKTQKKWIQDIFFPRLNIFNGKFPGTSFFFDFGNDDLMANRSLVADKAGEYFNLIHMELVDINPNLSLVGYMTVPPTPFKLKDWEKLDTANQDGIDENTRIKGAKTVTGVERPHKLKLSDGTIEDDLAKLTELLEKPPWQERLFLFISHCPPLDTKLDVIPDGRHVGSLAIRRFIEYWGDTGRLQAAFHGQIHESPWMSGEVYDQIEGVPCFNVGQQAGQLRSLYFDSTDLESSMKLVIVNDDGKSYKLTIHELSM
jgi:Icc-related predicted phosphoesterase